MLSEQNLPKIFRFRVALGYKIAALALLALVSFHPTLVEAQTNLPPTTVVANTGGFVIPSELYGYFQVYTNPMDGLFATIDSGEVYVDHKKLCKLLNEQRPPRLFR